MDKAVTKLTTTGRKRLLKDLEAVKTMVNEEEGFFNDHIAHKVTARFIAAKKARYAAINKALTVISGYLEERL